MFECALLHTRALTGPTLIPGLLADHEVVACPMNVDELSKLET